MLTSAVRDFSLGVCRTPTEKIFFIRRQQKTFFNTLQHDFSSASANKKHQASTIQKRGKGHLSGHPQRFLEVHLAPYHH
jgi:hypothetical protein